MSGTTFEIEDFDSALLELGDSGNLLALLLGHQDFRRLKTKVWQLHQALTDEEVSDEFTRLYTRIAKFYSEDRLKALIWIFTSNEQFGSKAPIECLFEDLLAEKRSDSVSVNHNGIVF